MMVYAASRRKDVIVYSMSVMTAGDVERRTRGESVHRAMRRGVMV